MGFHCIRKRVVNHLHVVKCLKLVRESEMPLKSKDLYHTNFSAAEILKVDFH